MVIGFVTPFLLPQEIRKLYEKDGQASPVSGKTGLWVLLLGIGSIIWLVKVQGALNAYWRGKGATA